MKIVDCFGSFVFFFEKVVWNGIFEIGVGIVCFMVYGDIICVCYSFWGVEGGLSDFKKNIYFKIGMLKRMEFVEF